MSNQPQILGNEESPDSGVRRRDARRYMSDSGVHAKLALAIASFGKEDADEIDDEAVTQVRLPAPQRHHAVAEPVVTNESPVLLDAELDDAADVQPAQVQNAVPGYQVALRLSQEELAQIWADERAALEGRAFVWSESSQSWAAMHDGHEALVSAPRVTRAEAHSARNTVLANFRQPAGWFLAGFSVAAAFLISFGVARGLGQHSQPAEITLNDVVVSAEQRSTELAIPVAAAESKSPTSSARIESADIIPVDSLPLVRDSRSSHWHDSAPIIPISALPLGAAQSVFAARSVEPRPVVAESAHAFNASRARQALDHASRLMQRCTGASELSGSAVVTFAPSGAVNDVAVQSIAGDVSKMSCVVSAFHAVRVPAFAGTAVSVKKSFGVRG